MELVTDFLPIQDVWDFRVDIDFAVNLVHSTSDIESLYNLLQHVKVVQVCDKCDNLNVCVSHFAVTYEVSDLEKNTKSGQCQLCALLYNAAARSGIPLLSTIQFKRVGSVLVVNDGPPVVSIIAGIDSGTYMNQVPLKCARTKSKRWHKLIALKFHGGQCPPDIQLSYPKLPKPGSATSAHLMQQWIRSCDTTHQCMTTVAGPGLPSRLLSTNYHVDGGVRLCPTAEMDPEVRYTALSFVWGKANKGHDRTLSHNLATFEERIDYEQLSKTIRDAIQVTYQLGIKYIWIDSLCVIQDVREDWAEASGQTEKIFSNAYCVLAASSALDVTKGFITPRRQRLAVPLKDFNGVAISACELIDDFQTDVDASPLSSRGWAFQERVLARRIIFFTSTQMYWQCGEGIHCETLMKLHKYVFPTSCSESEDILSL